MDLHARRPRPGVPLQLLPAARCSCSSADWHSCRVLRWISNVSRMSSSLEPKHKLSTESAIRPIEEIAEARAVHIVLHVAWIEMVEDVEHSNSHFEPAFLAAKRHGQFFERLEIE